MSITMETDLPYLSREPDRHGNDRLYVRRAGKRVRLRQPEGTPEFAEAYSAAIAKLGYRPASPMPAAVPGVRIWPKNTLGWLSTLFFASKGEGGFLDLDRDSRRAKRNLIEECLLVTHSEADPDPMGNCPIKFVSAQKARRMIEAVDGAGARTNRRKHLSTLFSWGVEANHIASNPIRDIKAGRVVKGGGFYTWTIPDVKQFLEFHAGEALRARKARLALALLLFSGSRRQDMVTLGKQHTRTAGWIRYVPKKTLYKRRTIVQKPLLPVLAQIIADSPCGELTFLQTEQGKAFTPAGFGNWFRDRCDEAVLPLCTAHGLKKAGATIAAENGATTRQMMAMFDWDTPAMAEVYTRSAEQKRLAGDAMFLISLERAS